MKNTAVRTISGIGFLAIMIAGLLWCRFSYGVLMLWIMIMMMREFFRMTMGDSYKFSQILAITTGAVLFCLTFIYKSYNLTGGLVALAIIPMAVVMIDSLYVKDKTEFGKFSNLYTGIVYIAVPITLSNFAVFDAVGSYNGWTMLCFFIMIWACDVGAFVFGCALGQRYGGRLFPSISPKKSWIGFWGGFAMSILAAVILQLGGMLPMNTWLAAVLGAVISVSGTYGDLVESQWKRHYEVKDSGTSIPGHGGYLDRFDSTLLALPAGIIFMELVRLLA